MMTRRRLLFILLLMLHTRAYDILWQMIVAYPSNTCAVPRDIEPAGLYEALDRAYRLNAMMDERVQAINHDFYSPEQILAAVRGWLPMIACIAREFELPPELLAGIIATEIDLDYHHADLIMDNLIRWTPLDGLVNWVEMGAGYAGVHYSHLRPALEAVQSMLPSTAYTRAYRRLIDSAPNTDLTTLATRSILLDLTNGALMTRYYMQERIGRRINRPLSVSDMAFIWSAYRGGINNTPADPPEERIYRWSVADLRAADDPHILGDCIISSAWFTYYRAVFTRA